jgi:predicted O-methyltransferase YrrM
VLPRLTDGHYDMVFIDADKREYADYLTEALRLLRPGGVLAIDNALWHDRVADPSQRDEETTVIRDLGREIASNDTLVPLLLPVGDGLLVAKKEWSSEVVLT